jgi:hypothetical protein
MARLNNWRKVMSETEVISARIARIYVAREAK